MFSLYIVKYEDVLAIILEEKSTWLYFRRFAQIDTCFCLSLLVWRWSILSVIEITSWMVEYDIHMREVRERRNCCSHGTHVFYRYLKCQVWRLTISTKSAAIWKSCASNREPDINVMTWYLNSMQGGREISFAAYSDLFNGWWCTFLSNQVLDLLGSSLMVYMKRVLSYKQYSYTSICWCSFCCLMSIY